MCLPGHTAAERFRDSSILLWEVAMSTRMHCDVSGCAKTTTQPGLDAWVRVIDQDTEITYDICPDHSMEVRALLNIE